MRPAALIIQIVSHRYGGCGEAERTVNSRANPEHRRGGGRDGKPPSSIYSSSSFCFFSVGVVCEFKSSGGEKEGGVNEWKED